MQIKLVTKGFCDEYSKEYSMEVGFGFVSRLGSNYPPENTKMIERLSGLAAELGISEEKEYLPIEKEIIRLNAYSASVEMTNTYRKSQQLKDIWLEAITQLVGHKMTAGDYSGILAISKVFSKSCLPTLLQLLFNACYTRMYASLSVQEGYSKYTFSIPGKDNAEIWVEDTKLRRDSEGQSILHYLAVKAHNRIGHLVPAIPGRPRVMKEEIPEVTKPNYTPNRGYIKGEY